ncbi:Uncharacterised protein [Streptococcus uberis]|uniref:hypothetical protein n=1 Tax=Streptococcus uberis TaxID=1349 RepID=UPI000DA3BA04|nr:hypothetical protein [Streptococcus uberis]SQG84097.1 Uncharacterised protein [Streptococcus uberis]
MYCRQLPNLITLEHFHGNFQSYQDYLYNEIFLKTLYNFKVVYNNKLVELKKLPLYDNREDSFYHLTCKEYKLESTEREPDLRRSEKLSWIRPTLESDHNKVCESDCCKTYIKKVGNKERIHILNPLDRFMIVLEDRKSYYLLITAYHIEYDNTLKKKLKEYDNYCQSLE